MAERKRRLQVVASPISASVEGASTRKASRPAHDVQTGGRFVSAFLDERGKVMLDRVARRLDLSKSQLAETVGLTTDVLYRPARMEAPKAQARASEMLEIIGRVAEWAGGERHALAWYRAEPLPSFGGRTAESLVKEGKAAAVREYLDRVATGGFA